MVNQDHFRISEQETVINRWEPCSKREKKQLSDRVVIPSITIPTRVWECVRFQSRGKRGGEGLVRSHSTG